MSYAIFIFLLENLLKIKHLSSGFVWFGIHYLDVCISYVCLLKILFMTCFVSCQLFKIDSLEWKLYKLLLLKKQQKKNNKNKKRRAFTKKEKRMIQTCKLPADLFIKNLNIFLWFIFAIYKMQILCVAMG